MHVEILWDTQHTGFTRDFIRLIIEAQEQVFIMLTLSVKRYHAREHTLFHNRYNIFLSRILLWFVRFQCCFHHHTCPPHPLTVPYWLANEHSSIQHSSPKLVQDTIMWLVLMFYTLLNVTHIHEHTHTIYKKTLVSTCFFSLPLFICPIQGASLYKVVEFNYKWAYWYWLWYPLSKQNCLQEGKENTLSHRYQLKSFCWY